MIANLLTDINNYSIAVEAGFDSSQIESQLLDSMLDCCLTTGCNTSILDMANNQTLSKRIENGFLYIAISDGNEIKISLADIGDDWGDQVAETSAGVTGTGVSGSPIRLSDEAKRRIETVFISINEVTVNERSAITTLPYDGQLKYVVPAEQVGYVYSGAKIHDSTSTGVILVNGNPATAGTTILAEGDVISTRILTLNAEFSATIKLTKSIS